METATGSETSIRFQNFELDLRTLELYRNGSRLKIRGHPVEVFAILLEHPGELIPRDALRKRIWPDDTFVDFEQILNNSVGKLRDALGDRAETPKFIETLPRLGYRFIAPLEKSEIDTHVAQAPIIAEPKPPSPIPDDSLGCSMVSDGRTLVFTNLHGDIYTISADGGEPRLLHREDGPASQFTRTKDIAWSPDGTTIRFTRLQGKIFEISSTGANLHEWLPGWNGGMQKRCGRWTPDGQFYLFMAERTLAKYFSFPPLAQIWAVDERRTKIRPRISEPILFASGPLLWGNPIPSLDGKKIFARGVSLGAELERYYTTSKRLTPYLGGMLADMPAFSRDGKYVAYVS